MRSAIKSALRGVVLHHGGPFGACISRGGKEIAAAHNTVLRDNDATCHAEINAIRQASRKLKTFDLSGCVLYSTAEPCPMCLGAIYWARIPVVYAGVTRRFVRRYGFRDEIIFNELGRKPKQRLVKLYSGFLLNECADVFVKWKKTQGKLY